MVVIAFLAAAIATALFVVVVVGIRASERRAGLPGPAQGRADVLTRRILAAHFLPEPVCSLRTARHSQMRRSSR